MITMTCPSMTWYVDDDGSSVTIDTRHLIMLPHTKSQLPPQQLFLNNKQLMIDPLCLSDFDEIVKRKTCVIHIRVEGGGK
jgi:hypothetical protein